MTDLNWNEIGNFERFPIFNLEKGKSKTVTFRDNGKLVSKDVLKQAKTKFPRDSYVFVLEENGQKCEFWINVKSYSTLVQFKSIRERHNNNLENVTVKITRVSENPREANYKIEET